MTYTLTKKGKQRIQYQIRKMKKEGAEGIPTVDGILQEVNEKGVTGFSWPGKAYCRVQWATPYAFYLTLGEHIEPAFPEDTPQDVRKAVLIALNNGLSKDDLFREAQCADDYNEWQYMCLMGYHGDTLREAAYLL